MKIKKYIALFIAFCMILSVNVYGKTVSSECLPDDLFEPFEAVSESVDYSDVNLEINAKSAILIEPFTSTVIYEKNASEILPPASITKIMSLLLIMEAIDRKELTTEEIVTASEHAASMGGSQIWLKENESMTVDDLLKATVIASANDATVALAEKVAGSEEAFTDLMNKRAKELGMENTHFENCTGLDSEKHLTSAYDVALMSCELIKHPLIKKYSTVWMDSLRNGESELVNTNKLVRFYEGTTGLKTGTTSSAGYCLSATANRNGTEFVAVIMGGNTSNDRFSGAKKLLDYGFANYILSEIKPEKDNFSVNVLNGTEKTFNAKAESGAKLLLKKTDVTKTEQKINIDTDLTAPIKKGQTVGNICITLNGEEIARIDIKSTEEVGKMKFSIAFIGIIRQIFKI